MSDDALTFSPNTTAGWVALEIDNITDHPRWFGLHRMPCGKTLEDLRAAALADHAGAEDPYAAVLVPDPLVGALHHGPGSTHDRRPCRGR